jgi:uncharacterized membrane protein
MEKLIQKAVRWMVFIPAVVVALHIAQKVFARCVEQAFLYAPGFGMFLLLLIPGLIVWMIIGIFIYTIFKSIAVICPSAKGAKITMTVLSIIYIGGIYFKITEAASYPFFQEFGIFIWAYSMYGLTIRGAQELLEKKQKEETKEEPELSFDLLDDQPMKAA